MFGRIECGKGQLLRSGVLGNLKSMDEYGVNQALGRRRYNRPCKAVYFRRTCLSLLGHSSDPMKSVPPSVLAGWAKSTVPAIIHWIAPLRSRLFRRSFRGILFASSG